MGNTGKGRMDPPVKPEGDEVGRERGIDKMLDIMCIFLYMKYTYLGETDGSCVTSRKAGPGCVSNRWSNAR